MVPQEIIDAAKLRVRKTKTDVLDNDVKQLAEAAACDLKRIGVADRFLFTDADALIKEAVLTFVNANYGDNPSAERLMQSYNMILIKIKGGKYRV